MNPKVVRIKIVEAFVIIICIFILLDAESMGFCYIFIFWGYFLSKVMCCVCGFLFLRRATGTLTFAMPLMYVFSIVDGSVTPVMSSVSSPHTNTKQTV